VAWTIYETADYVRETQDREYYLSAHIYERIRRAFDKSITVDEDSGCWVWKYPNLVFKTPETREFDARKVSYNYHVDTLFSNERITMTCGNSMCVNPEHMEVEKT
jgi:hypothetical protein